MAANKPFVDGGGTGWEERAGGNVPPAAKGMALSTLGGLVTCRIASRIGVPAAAGSLYAHFTAYISPEAFEPMNATFLGWVMLIGEERHVSKLLERAAGSGPADGGPGRSTTAVD